MDQIEEALSQSFNTLINARLAHIRNPDEDTQDQLEEAQQKFDQYRALREEMLNILPEPVVNGGNGAEEVNEEEPDEVAAPEEIEEPVNHDEIGPIFRNSKMRAKLPKFSGVFIKEPIIFLRAFSKTMRLNSVPKIQWYCWFPTTLEDNSSIWYYKFVDAKKITEWKTIKQLFIKNFAKIDHASISLQKLAEIKQMHDETAENFSDRFKNLMFDAGMDDNNPTALLWFQKALPPSKQQILVAMISASENPTVTMAADMLRRLDIAHYSSKYCLHCRTSTHNTGECRSRNHERNMFPENRNNSKETGKKRLPNQTDLSLIRCYKCNQNGHYASNCPKKMKPNISLVIGPERSVLQDEIQHNHGSIVVPMKVNGHKVFSSLDTCADVSIIDKSLSEMLQITASGTTELTLAQKDITISAETCSVNIQCNGKSIEATICILDLPTGKNFLLGNDIMYLFGIKINGLPIDFTPVQLEKESEFYLKNQNSGEPINDTTFHRIQTKVKQVLDKNGKLNRTNLCTLNYAVVYLNTKNSPIVNRRQYPLPHTIMPKVLERLEQWLIDGTIIEAPVECLWNSPLLAVPKKDENGNSTGVRLCLDTRGLNQCLEDLPYTLPLVKDIFKTISGFQIASRLDLADSFNQLPINESDRQKTTFSINGRRFMFRGAPFGIKTLSAHLQQVLAILLEPITEFCIHFIDDIIIFSKDEDSHINHLNAVITLLNDAGLKLREEKCLWGLQELRLLGHIVDSNSIRADPRKLSSFQKVITPTTGKELESFLGVAGYLRQYIPCYAKISAPLEKIRKTKGSLKSVWNKEHDESIEKIKAVLSSPPFLRVPNFKYPFKVGTDASNSGVGAVLYQEYDDTTHYICLMSKALTPAQRNYPATKKELLAIVLALQHFREWIWGSHFELYTDHMSLVYLFSAKKENLMLSNWFDKLLEYDFTIIHCPGISHTLPDFLSRIYYSSPQLETKQINLVSSHVPKPFITLAKHIKQVLNKEIPEDKIQCLEHYHLINHQGAHKLFESIFDAGYYWPEMRRDCEQFVEKCKPCLSFNVSAMGFRPLQTIEAQLPLDHVAVDSFGPFPASKTCGSTGVVLILDITSRFVVLKAVQDKSAATTAKCLYETFCLLGFPKIIQSDNGSEFVNSILKSWFDQTGVEHRLITPYHPEANGAAERHVGLSKTLLFKLINGDVSDWAAFLPAVQYGLNLRISSRHKSTPFALMFGRTANGFSSYIGTNSNPISEKSLIERSNQIVDAVFPALLEMSREYGKRSAKYFNKSKKIVDSFKEADIVMLKNINKKRKGDAIWLGPYTIAKSHGSGCYSLKDRTNSLMTTRVSQKHLKLVKTDMKEMETESFEINEILDHRGHGDKREYFVSWKGYPESENSWIPIGNFDTMDLVVEYHRTSK